jgi:hypothetical protein
VDADGAQKVHHGHVAVPGDIIFCTDINVSVRGEHNAIVCIEQRALEEELDGIDQRDGVVRSRLGLGQFALGGAA